MFPGYSGMRLYGYRSFLAMALGFALLLNAFLFVNFYWTALITAYQRNLSLMLLLCVWAALSIAASYQKRLITSIKPEENDATFRQTICLYLRGEWLAAEAQMIPYLKKYPKDVEMLLLQAAMYRHMERYEEARIRLDQIQLLQDSRYWMAEIADERTKIAKETASS